MEMGWHRCSSGFIRVLATVSSIPPFPHAVADLGHRGVVVFVIGQQPLLGRGRFVWVCAGLRFGQIGLRDRAAGIINAPVESEEWGDLLDARPVQRDEVGFEYSLQIYEHAGFWVNEVSDLGESQEGFEFRLFWVRPVEDLDCLSA